MAERLSCSSQAVELGVQGGKLTLSRPPSLVSQDLWQLFVHGCPVSSWRQLRIKLLINSFSLDLHMVE